MSQFLFLVLDPATEDSNGFSAMIHGAKALWAGAAFSLGESLYVYYFTSYGDFCSRPPMIEINGEYPENVHPAYINPDERAKHNSWLLASTGTLLALEFALLWFTKKAFLAFWSLWKFEQDGTLTTAFHSTIVLLIIVGLWSLCLALAALIVALPVYHMCTIAKQAGFYPLKLMDRPVNDQDKRDHTKVSLLEPD